MEICKMGLNPVSMMDSWNLNYKLSYVPAYSYTNFLIETLLIAEPNEISLKKEASDNKEEVIG